MTVSGRQDDYQRVLRSMRERLFAVSSEIANALTKADWQSERAPMSVRISSRAAAAEIANTQNWLHERLARLPDSPRLQVAAMQELLQVQFIALQKITAVVENLVALRDRPAAAEYLPPGAQAQPMPPLATPDYLTTQIFGAAPGQTGLALPMPQPQHAQQQAPRSWLPDLLPSAAPQPPLMLEQPRRDYHSPQRQAVRLADLEASSPTKRTGTGEPQTVRSKSSTSRPRRESQPKSRSTLRMGATSALLVAAIATVAAGGYYAAKKFRGTSTTATAAKKERVAVGDPRARYGVSGGDSLPPVRLEKSGTPGNRIPQAPHMGDPPFQNTGQFPGVALGESGTRTSAIPAQTYVAVLGTHRDRNALVAMYNELRSKYGAVLQPYKPEAQPVNLGDKGVWHHLLLLPAGKREEAQAICDSLRAAGHARCFVRPY